MVDLGRNPKAISKGVADMVFLQVVGIEGTRKSSLRWNHFITAFCMLASKKFCDDEPLPALEKTIVRHLLHLKESTVYKVSIYKG